MGDLGGRLELDTVGAPPPLRCVLRAAEQTEEREVPKHRGHSALLPEIRRGCV